MMNYATTSIIVMTTLLLTACAPGRESMTERKFRQKFVVNMQWEPCPVLLSVHSHVYALARAGNQPNADIVRRVQEIYSADERSSSDYVQALYNWYRFGVSTRIEDVESAQSQFKSDLHMHIGELHRAHLGLTGDRVGYAQLLDAYYELLLDEALELYR